MKFKILSRPFLPVILLITALSILLISYLRLTDNYELETLDFRFSLRSNQPTTDKVAIIEISDDTIKNLGKWPLDRSYHAFLIKSLSEAGAKAIVFDIFFSEPREHDDDLENAIRDAGNVYLPFVFDSVIKKVNQSVCAKDYMARNLDRFSAFAKGEGHINIFPDTDGKFRRVPMLVSYKGVQYPYLSFLVSCDYLGTHIKDVKIYSGKYIICGRDIKIPLDDSSNMIINFSGKWDKAYKHYSYHDIIQSYLASTIGQKPILDLNVFKDKICIIGLTAAGTVDLHPNPLESLYPGFGIHAEVFNSILNRRFITRASKGWNLAILIVLTILTSLITLKTKPIKGLLALMIGSLIFIAISILLFDLFGVWIDLFYPIAALILLYLSFTLCKYIWEWKKRLLLENELEIARSIQKSFLPKHSPHVAGLDVGSVMFTARQVGGDLYDFICFEDGKIGVMIGDVSGKGVPASLFMAKIISEFRFFATSESSPQDVLYKLNSKLVKESSSNLFVTMFYMIFDMKNKVVSYSNGGHLAVLHLGRSETAQFLDVPEGTPLGLIDSSYVSKEMPLHGGDIFVLYTDGITEAMNSRSEMYGEERFASMVRSVRNLSAEHLLNAIEKDVRNFEHKASQHDDMALIAIKVT